jgi:hypothetical protein
MRASMPTRHFAGECRNALGYCRAAWIAGSSPAMTKEGPGRLFLPLFPAEGRDHFFFADARGWVAAFAEVLLLGAIAHHTGMRYL